MLPDLSFQTSPTVKFISQLSAAKNNPEANPQTALVNPVKETPDVRDLIKPETKELQKIEGVNKEIAKFDIQDFFTPEEGEHIYNLEGLRHYAVLKIRNKHKDKLKGNRNHREGIA